MPTDAHGRAAGAARRARRARAHARCSKPRWSATCSGTGRWRRSTRRRSMRSRCCCASSSSCAATASSTRGEYAFQHHLLHQVTYDGVLKEQRQRGHERVGGFWSARAEVEEPQDVTPAACRALAEAHDHRRTRRRRRRSRPGSTPVLQLLQRPCHPHAAPAGRVGGRAVRAALRARPCRDGAGADQPGARGGAPARDGRGRAGASPRARDPGARARRRPPRHGADVAVLGGYLQGRGDYAGAEPFFRRALEVRERLLGSDHPLTLGTLEQPRLPRQGARPPRRGREPQSARAAGARAHPGPETPETAIALTALGEVLAKKGDVERRRAAVPAGARRCSSSGSRPTTPTLGLTMWHLAEVLRVLERCDEAETLARRTLEIWEGSFGPEHEWTAWGLISLCGSAAGAGRRGRGDRRCRAGGEDRRATVRRGARGPRIDPRTCTGAPCWPRGETPRRSPCWRARSRSRHRSAPSAMPRRRPRGPSSTSARRGLRRPHPPELPRAAGIPAPHPRGSRVGAHRA